MAGNELQLGIKITADGRLVVSESGRVVGALKGIEAQTQKIAESSGRMATATAAMIGHYGTAIFALKQGFDAVAGTARQAFDTINQFEKLKARLETLTGGVANARTAFAALQQFAAQTPFTLDQAVEAFARLKSLGLDASERSLRSFGNTAAATGKDLMQFIEAVADASTGEFERLKEFGIKASVEGDKVKLTFQGVTAEVGKDAASITEYLRRIGEEKFGDAMQRQMEGLPGAVSNLDDAIAALWRTVGDAGATKIMVDGLHDLTDATQGAASLFLEMGVAWNQSQDSVFSGVARALNEIGATEKAQRFIKAAIQQRQDARDLQQQLDDLTNSANTAGDALAKLGSNGDGKPTAPAPKTSASPKTSVAANDLAEQKVSLIADAFDEASQKVTDAYEKIHTAETELADSKAIARSVDALKAMGLAGKDLDASFELIKAHAQAMREALDLPPELRDKFIAIKDESARIAQDLGKVGDASKKMTDDMSKFAEQAARNMQSAFADFLFDPFKGGVAGMLTGFLEVLRRMLAEAAAAKIGEALFGSMGQKKADGSGGDWGWVGSLLSVAGTAAGAYFGGGGFSSAESADILLNSGTAVPGTFSEVRAPMRRSLPLRLAEAPKPYFFREDAAALPGIASATGGRGDAVTVNVPVHVDNRGNATNGAGDDTARRMTALGGAIKQAVQAEILNQQRAGGLLAGASR